MTISRVLQFGSGVLLRGLIDPILGETLGDRVVTVIQSTGSARARALNEGGGRYTLITRGLASGERVQATETISAIDRAIPAADWRDVLEFARAAPIDLIVSNTTEAGLALDDGDADTVPPSSFPAKLAALLAEQYALDPGAPPVVLPCELVPKAGSTLRALCLRAAQRLSLGADAARWIERTVPFCDTLVDRICNPAAKGDPALNDADPADSMAAVVEPFAMWAIAADGPSAERLAPLAAHDAVIIRPDITPLHERKTRILNGTHTASVAMGLLAGHELVRTTMGDPALRGFVEQFIRSEAEPFVDAPDTARFCEDVLGRLANPFIDHRLTDITVAHARKLPLRIAPSAAAFLASEGRPPPRICHGLAAYLLLARRRDPVLRDEDAAAIAALAGERDTDWDAAAARALTDPASPLAAGFADLGPAFVQAVANAARTLEDAADTGPDAVRKVASTPR